MPPANSAIPADPPVPAHPPELYTRTQIAPRLDSVDEFGPQQARFFADNGYLAIQHFFPRDKVEAAAEAMDDLIDGSRANFRGVQFEPGVGEKKGISEQQRRLSVRKIMSFVEFDKRLKSMAENPQLLAILEELIGSKPVLFQDMGLMKPPRIGREKPWHQDCAYFDFALGTPVVAAWIALDAATLENGCLHVISGSHLDGPRNHFKRRDWQMCDTDVPTDQDLAVPMEPGGVLFWHGLTHHGSPTNHTDSRRRALQLHYAPADAAKITTEERMQVFGGDVRGAEC